MGNCERGLSQKTITPDVFAQRQANRKYYLEDQERRALPRIIKNLLDEAVSSQKGKKLEESTGQ